MSGYFLVHRGWLESDLFVDEPFDRRSAWLWMIEQASWEDRTVVVGSDRIRLSRGQFTASHRYMAQAWGWDEKKVRRFLDRARKMGSIETSTGPALSGGRLKTAAPPAAGQTIITISNFNKFQAVGNAPAAPPAAPAPHLRLTNAANTKEMKEEGEGAARAHDPRIARVRAREEPPPPDPEEEKRKAAEYDAFCKDALWQCCQVMKLLAPPPDHPLLKIWLDAGANFEEDILPVVERVSEKFHAKQQPPRRFALFTPDVRAKVLERREADRRFWEWMKIDESLEPSVILIDHEGKPFH